MKMPKSGIQIDYLSKKKNILLRNSRIFRNFWIFGARYQKIYETM